MAELQVPKGPLVGKLMTQQVRTGSSDGSKGESQLPHRLRATGMIVTGQTMTGYWQIDESSASESVSH